MTPVRPLFFFDVGSPWCWLAGEQVNVVVEPVPEWIPVEGDEGGVRVAAVDREEFERRVTGLGLPDMRWPNPFPFDSHVAALGATFAKQAGRTVAFSLAAMRQAFAAGRDLSVVDNVLIAAAACELHPRAMLKGIESRSVAQALADANAAAATQGVSVVPAICGEEGVVEGLDCLAWLDRRARRA